MLVPYRAHLARASIRSVLLVVQAADRVGAAVKELNTANEYQKKSRTMLCIYLLLLLCGVMVVILIMKKTL